MLTTQRYPIGSLSNNFMASKLCVQNCIKAVMGWMDSNKLMLNSDKTEILTMGTASCINQVNLTLILSRFWTLPSLSKSLLNTSV